MIQMPEELVGEILNRCAMLDENLVARATAEVRAEHLERKLREVMAEQDPVEEDPPSEGEE